jgi:lipoprotein-anchoring transpeptidase ErfK/SrfK
MNTTLKTLGLASLITAGLLSGQAMAGEKAPFAGVVIVPAAAAPEAQVELKRSASPVQDEALRGKIVNYATTKAAGSIVINSKKNVLYYVLGNGKALMYRVATAKKGFEWTGSHKVSAKTQWPDWRPPVEMRKRRPELPTYMAGGPKNPLGARAMYLGASIYRIHGTNEPTSIGKSASSGCIRMLNADVTELYRFVKIGAEVSVI